MAVRKRQKEKSPATEQLAALPAVWNDQIQLRDLGAMQAWDQGRTWHERPSKRT